MPYVDLNTVNNPPADASTDPASAGGLIDQPPEGTPEREIDDALAEAETSLAKARQILHGD